jgi:octaprenyl-diphosphate synthase
MLQGRSKFIAGDGYRIYSSKSKRLRPILTLLSAHMFGPAPENAIYLAVAAEMIHAATLIHDDIIDNAELRRGQKTIHTTEGDKIAVLVGDFFVGQALNIVSNHVGIDYTSDLSHTIAVMCEGEINELVKLIRSDQRALTTEGDYYKIVSEKTAQLMADCCRLGGKLGGASVAQQNHLDAFGKNLGICFQIIDDILDVEGESNDLGKHIRNDHANGKLTLPDIIGLLAAKAKALEFLKDALDHLEQLPGSKANHSLKNITRRLLERQS